MSTEEINAESTARATLVYPQHAQLGEGSIWSVDKQALIWIDIEGRKLFVYHPNDNTNQAFDLPERPGTVVERTNGELLVAVKGGIRTFNIYTKESMIITNPETEPTNRYNDGKCDPQGRFWIGSMSLKSGEPAVASLYRVNHDLSSERILSGIKISNGLVWSLDQKKFYYIDTPTMGVDEFDYDAHSGSISNRKRCISFTGQDGFPDGMTIDAEGKLWIAHWDGGRVTRWDPNTKQRIFTVTVPNVSKVTSVAFGDYDLQTLYITTARDGGQPDSGSLFKYRFTNGIKGIPAYKFRG
ncbi:hypothetical protein DICPUDRAFT_72325 [Dictyostelium purpureum]|uniref:SMP-30/Gluconolactonase/LRE-like region domain-containing protein n=1 Tax=Dictyostelium purpureum TaxID=5786 RepID=F0ZJR0_DICPU|nr:uncharacterized protein DICPUDRAFT_72325 [Dictyostelium purpureum]EGC35811.1 hypothetical protein DICPUDRAFT_72325 [Dictyostelium purpureum]|eukprot:XP_003287648.1 hypothetical protein DICPUDRAFT_72325 [Dictyostelium purpureum]